MSIDLEHDKENNKYYVHDTTDGWLTAEITETEYNFIKLKGLKTKYKQLLNWK